MVARRRRVAARRGLVDGADGDDGGVGAVDGVRAVDVGALLRRVPAPPAARRAGPSVRLAMTGSLAMNR